MKKQLLFLTLLLLNVFLLNAQPSPDKFSTFVDSRDGKKYRAIAIGGQTWMAQNLNFNVKGSTCYDSLGKNCDTYGRLYEYSVAINACPSGWHLPSAVEWDQLGKTLDPKYNSSATNGIYSTTAGNKLKATSGWTSPNGEVTNESGFSAIPGGWRDWTGDYYILGRGAGFWTSSKNEKGLASIRYLHHNSGVMVAHDVTPRNGNAVRCIKNRQ